MCTEQVRRREADSSDCSTSRNTCDLLLVADELFYEHIGVSSVPHTVRILVSRL